MPEYVANVTSKGRITLPAAVRRELGINPGDRVLIVLEDDHVARLQRFEYDVTSVRGLIPSPPGLETDDFDDLIEEAMADHADAFMRRMRQATR